MGGCHRGIISAHASWSARSAAGCPSYALLRTPPYVRSGRQGTTGKAQSRTGIFNAGLKFAMYIAVRHRDKVLSPRDVTHVVKCTRLSPRFSVQVRIQRSRNNCARKGGSLGTRLISITKSKRVDENITCCIHNPKKSRHISVSVSVIM